MAEADPTGSGRTVALDIPAHRVAFPRKTFAVVRDGLLGDFAERSGGLRDPQRSWLKARACTRLIAALDRGEVVADGDLLDILSEFARSVDKDARYERVVCEHDALWGLHAKLAVALAGEGR
jgi:hypothetical protein